MWQIVLIQSSVSLMSAGRLYDKIGDTAYAKVVLVTPAGTICKICKKSLKSEQEETAWIIL